MIAMLHMGQPGKGFYSEKDEIHDQCYRLGKSEWCSYSEKDEINEITELRMIG